MAGHIGIVPAFVFSQGSVATHSVGHELTQISFNLRVKSVIVSCEFEITHPNRCKL